MPIATRCCPDAVLHASSKCADHCRGQRIQHDHLATRTGANDVTAIVAEAGRSRLPCWCILSSRQRLCQQNSAIWVVRLCDIIIVIINEATTCMQSMVLHAERSIITDTLSQLSRPSSTNLLEENPVV